MHIEKTEPSTACLTSPAIAPNDDDDRTPLDVVVALAKRKLAVSPRVAREVLDLGNTRLYELLGNGELASYKDGASRKILTSSMLDYARHRIAEPGPRGKSGRRPRPS